MPLTLASLAAEVKLEGADKLKADLQDIGAKVRQSATQVGALGTSTDSLATELRAGFSEVGAAFNALTGDAVPRLLASIGGMSDRFRAFVSDGLGSLVTHIPGVQGAMALLSGAADRVRERVSQMADGVRSRIGDLTAALGRTRDAAEELAARGLSTLNARFPFISEGLGKVHDGAEKVAGVLSGALHTALDRVGEAIPHVREAAEHFHTALDTVKERLGAVGEAAGRAAAKLSPLKDAAERVGGGFLHAGGTIAKFGGIAAGIGLVGIAGGVALVASKLGDFIHAGEDANAIAAQTAAVLKSTNGAAGVTAAAVDKLSTSLMNQTGIDDDTIRSTQNMLLTFTGIGAKGGVFDQATKTALDMSTALGQDTKSSAIQLGKALNDPLTGITALQRVGVTFTKSQKDQIKAMMDHGDVAKAQGVILKELNKEFGGSAEAAGKANGGVKIFQAELNNAKQSIGQALIPIISSLLGKLAPLVQQFGQWLPGALKVATDFIQTKVAPTLDRLADFLIKNVVPALKQLGDFIFKNVLPVLTQMWSFQAQHLMPIIKALAGIFMDDVLPALKQVWESVSKNLIPALEHAWEAIAPKLIPILQKLGMFLRDQIAPIIANVVVPVLGFLISHLGDLAGAIFGFIDGALTAFGNAWNGLVSIVGGVWTAIENIAVGAINFLIDRINDVIDLANRVPGVHFDHINHLVLGGGITTDKGSGGASTTSGGGKTRFASGGYSPGGPILVGENGPEILAPAAGSRIFSNSETVSLIRDAVKSSAAGGAAGNGSGSGHTFNIHVHKTNASARDIMDEIQWQLTLRS